MTVRCSDQLSPSVECNIKTAMYYFCLIQINSLYILFVAGKYLLLELYSNSNLMGNCFHFKGVIQSCHPCTYFFSLVYSTQNFTNSMDNIVENF